jgi:hypothetical protein
MQNAYQYTPILVADLMYSAGRKYYFEDLKGSKNGWTSCSMNEKECRSDV